ncbi:MAG TPA: XdhC/CoxI family protein [Caproicibacter sp.]|nr:XdhC/CoxI family protein [Caproicibacter sp.]
MGNEIYSQLLNQLRSGRNIVLVSQLDGTQGKKESAMTKQLVDRDEYSEIALEALKSGLPITQQRQDTVTIAEPFYPEERLIVLGGGHIALPLVDFASKIGFSVTVVDDRPDFANSSRFPSAKNVICESFEKAIEQLKITQNDYVVIITRGHRYDQVCLEKLLAGTEPFYTGMIGSRKRVAVVKNTLITQGYSQERLNRIHTPIGLAIGAVTPEEISISIVAEIIQCKRLKSLDANHFGSRSDVDFSVITALADNIRQASLVTVISSKGPVPRGAGAKMIVYPDGRIAGSIGGGCSEAAVIGNARSIIGTGEYRLQTVDMTGDSAEDEGMVCGGIMQVLIEDL